MDIVEQLKERSNLLKDDCVGKSSLLIVGGGETIIERERRWER